jgi:hypothetical protein
MDFSAFPGEVLVEDQAFDVEPVRCATYNSAQGTRNALAQRNQM